jgi:RNA polymerase sigma-70 factor (ECF subfamily)
MELALKLEFKTAQTINDYVNLSCISRMNKDINSPDHWVQLMRKVSSQKCTHSFREIFNYFYPRLVSWAQKGGLKKEQALELAQEIFFKVWQHANSFDESKGPFQVWFYTIARNQKFDFLRKLKNDPLYFSSSDIFIDHVFSDEGDHLSSIEDHDFNRLIHLLPFEQQEVMVKFYREGLSHQEIADLMKLPLGTIKSRIRLAVSTLKNILEQD